MVTALIESKYSQICTCCDFELSVLETYNKRKSMKAVKAN